MRLAVVDADPTSSGVSLPIGSLAAFNNGGTGEFYQKTGSSSTAWTLFATGNPNVSAATGTLSIGHGGTGQTTQTAAFDALSPLTTLGDTIYDDGTHNVRLAGNTTTTKQYLSQTGTGSVSAAPAWAQVNFSDLAGTAAVNQGGTGQTSYTDGQLLIGNTTGNTLVKATLTAGQNTTITNGAGSITVASSADETIAVNTVSTTDATATTIQTIATTSNQVQLVKIKVLGYRTGGSAGTAGDSATFEHTLRIKNVAGTVTVVDNQTDYSSQDQTWTVTFTVSSTNVLVQVTGAVNNNIDWKSESFINALS